MSVHLPTTATPHDSDADLSSSSSEDSDQDWEDWISDSGLKPCKSLFEDAVFPSASEALHHDKTKHGFDLEATCSKLSLDFHGRVRLINYIRKESPSPTSLALFSGSEIFLSDDRYLQPVIEDDPLLQLQTDDWTDSGDEKRRESSSETTQGQDHSSEQRIRRLKEKLALARQDVADFRNLIQRHLDTSLVTEKFENLALSGDAGEPAARDDDSHYFRSYAENDIHAVMIQDSLRTSSYASFILSNPAVFRGATVLDVGCGTGILSLFAARAGAKRVFAVDASDIALKAKKIVQANNFADVITVIKGKIEDITLPDGIKEVDVIVSEWMGYALLYESMLDSVLFARDRFLRPGGVMVPSQCRMMLGIAEAAEIFKERVRFWDDVYGFDLSAMATDVYEDALVDIVSPESLVSNVVIVKDLPLESMSQKSLNFSSTFSFAATRRVTKARAFVLYFDTFFVPSGRPVPPDAQVHVVKEGEVALAEVWRLPGNSKKRDTIDGKGKEVSFSTGPSGTPTHWKQTLFLLREPISLNEGTKVSGTFYCRKSEDNSRELNIEIHYCVSEDGQASPPDTIVQMFSVR